MITQQIDGSLFNRMINLGAHRLMNNREKINDLNVFPVPDGDTGTNMSLSMTSGVNEMKKVDSKRVFELSNAFARGLLMGARGNSGVILSQLFRGFSESVHNKDIINTKELANALQAGVKAAYKSVTEPVEGTILTVAKDVANYATKISDDVNDMTSFLAKIVEEGKQSLSRTPTLLPILKEVGVVDSGGKGLLTIYEGFLAALTGENIEEDEEEQLTNIDELIAKEHDRAVQSYFNEESIEFGYCTEFIVEFEEDKLNENKFDEQQYRLKLSEYGDSLLVAADETLVKVHIHTEEPGEVMTFSQQFGRLTNIDIENMRKQYEEIVQQEAQQKAEKQEKIDCAIITVASGSGVQETFKSLGATHIVEGGQTMNPSTEDLLQAIEKVNAKSYIILPNNKNIILAAEQTAEIAEQPVEVVPTASIQQGLSAILEFNPDLSIEENKEIMVEASRHIKDGAITYATRDTVIDGLTINQNDFIGIQAGDITVSHANKLQAAEQLLTQLVNEDEDEILTVFYGEDMTDEEKKQFEKIVSGVYDDLDIEFHEGNQAVYSFLFMVE